MKISLKEMNVGEACRVIGNPNCGKTTLFNGLTGSRQHVGNWAGVTVEQKTGQYRYDNKIIKVVDLLGIDTPFLISYIGCRLLKSRCHCLTRPTAWS